VRSPSDLSLSCWIRHKINTK